MAIASAKAISPVIGSEISFPAFAFRMIISPRVEIDIVLADHGQFGRTTAGQQRGEMIALMNRVFDLVPCLAPR